MGHPRRYFENNSVYFITNRLARGLPLVPCKYINNILLGIMAKASEAYPSIKICNYLWMSNHYHILIVTSGDPADLAGFMNILDGETAKAVVKFLNLKNVKVWAQRYNPIRLLTPDVVVEKIAYLYLNPVTANIVDKACRWPGVSSYTIQEEKILECEYKSPSKLSYLLNQSLSKEINKELIKDSKKGQKHYLRVSPYAWLDCFEEAESHDFYRHQISAKISAEEKRLEEKRQYPVIGASKVKTQNPHQGYKPENKGKRMFCMSSCLELRKQFIELYKDFCESCTNAWKSWKAGNQNQKFPPGAFHPPNPPLSSALKLIT